MNVDNDEKLILFTITLILLIVIDRIFVCLLKRLKVSFVKYITLKKFKLNK